MHHSTSPIPAPRANRPQKKRLHSRQSALQPLEPRSLLSATILPINTQSIDPTRQTWVVIHGRDDSPAGMAPISDALANLRDPQGHFFQVLAVDWSQDAHPASSTDFSEEANIPTDGQAAADALKALGFNAGISATNLNLVGHSWGADLAYEISKDLTGGVNRLVALDPAQDAKILSQGSDTYDTDAADFAANSQYSLAFLSSLWGSEIAAATADDSVIVGYDNTSWGYASLSAQDTTAHSLIKELFPTLLRNNWFPAAAGPISQLFAPDQLRSDRSVPWQRNHFSVTDAQGFLSYGSPNPFPAGVTIGKTSGPYDAEIRAAKITDGAATIWYPYKLEYFDSTNTDTSIAETAPPTTQLTLASVNPTSLQPSTQLKTIELTGTGFRPDSTLDLNDGTTDIPSDPAHLRVLSSTKIQYDLTPGTTAATWTVKVQNPATASNPATFTILQPLPGDANLDGKVDFADLVAVAQNYGGTGKIRAQGDFNNDGKVDFADLVIVAQNYGKSQPTAAPLPSTAAAPVLSKSITTNSTPKPQKPTALFAPKPIKRKSVFA